MTTTPSRPALAGLFAGPPRRATVSPIARTIEIAERTPGLVSFACGNPASEALPVKEIADAFAAAVTEEPDRALQYGRPRGLIQGALVEHLARDGITASPAELLPTTGAIQALTLIAHALVAEGDIVVTEWPTYPVNLASFRTHGARTIGVPMDGEGIQVAVLERLLAVLASAGRPPKLIYVIPDGHNPTGITMSAARRAALAAVAARYGVLLVEDAPYRRLDFAGRPEPALWTYASEAGAAAAYVGSFAKTVAPGLRVGYLLADPELIDTAVLLKQGEDFCTAGALQLVIERLIRGGVVARQEARFAAVHATKMAAMAAGLERELQGLPVHWTRPRGGLFVWLELSGAGVDSDAILERAIGNGVAFIPGRYFYPDELAGEDGQPHPSPAPTHTLRLNFSYPPLADIPRGVAALGRTLREFL